MRRFLPEDQKIYLTDEINKLKIQFTNNAHCIRSRMCIENNIKEYEHIIKLIDYGLFNVNDYHIYDNLYKHHHQFSAFVKYANDKIDEYKQSVSILLDEHMLHDLGKMAIEYI